MFVEVGVKGLFPRVVATVFNVGRVHVVLCYHRRGGLDGWCQGVGRTYAGNRCAERNRGRDSVYGNGGFYFVAVSERAVRCVVSCWERGVVCRDSILCVPHMASCRLNLGLPFSMVRVQIVVPLPHFPLGL